VVGVSAVNQKRGVQQKGTKKWFRRGLRGRRNYSFRWGAAQASLALIVERMKEMICTNKRGVKEKKIGVFK